MKSREAPLRIAILSEVFLPKIDGVTNRLRYTVPELHRLGHRTQLFVPEDAATEFDGEALHRVPGARFPAEPSLRISCPTLSFVRALRAFRPDVVHALAPTCLGAWGLWVARALGVPRVASFHTDLPRYLPRYGLRWLRPAVWPFLRRVHGLADLTLCPSMPVRRELRAHGVSVAGIWRGGVDTDRFHPRRRSAAMRARLAADPERPIVLIAGRMAPEKNLQKILEIIPQHPDYAFSFVGDGPTRQGLEPALARRRVRFLGFLEGDDYAAALASADVLLQPSETETMGFVVLEALSAGCPVLAADAGATPDLIRDGETGLLFAGASGAQASERLDWLVERPEVRRELARGGRKRALEHTWETETRGLVEAYRKAIERNRAAR